MTDDEVRCLGSYDYLPQLLVEPIEFPLLSNEIVEQLRLIGDLIHANDLPPVRGTDTRPAARSVRPLAR